MGDVGSDGESYICPFCTDKVKMGISSSPAEGDSKNLGNMSNYSHSAPGAQCLVIPSAPAPCQPNAQPIDPGQSPLAIDGKTALGSGCKFMCCKGGLLTVSSSAQSSATHNGAGGAQVVTPPNVTYTNIERRKAANDNNFGQKKLRDKRGKLLDNKRKKPVHFPSAKKVKIEMEHIASGHMQGGSRANQSKIKTTFPVHMKEKDVERAIKQAYKRGKLIHRQENKVKIRGVSDDGQKIEIWVNVKTGTIDTAYPIHR